MEATLGVICSLNTIRIRESILGIGYYPPPRPPWQTGEEPMVIMKEPVIETSDLGYYQRTSKKTSNLGYY